MSGNEHHCVTGSFISEAFVRLVLPTRLAKETRPDSGKG